MNTEILEVIVYINNRIEILNDYLLSEHSITYDSIVKGRIDELENLEKYLYTFLK